MTDKLIAAIEGRIEDQNKKLEILYKVIGIFEPFGRPDSGMIAFVDGPVYAIDDFEALGFTKEEAEWLVAEVKRRAEK